MEQILNEVSRNYLISDLPEHERPRERLAKRGSEALSDIELLAIVLKSGPAGMSTLDLARSLLRAFNHDLALLSRASIAQLQKIKGIGPAKAAELKATFALAGRLVEHIQPERPALSSPQAVANIMREQFRGKKQEELHVLLLSTRNQLLASSCITVGLLDRSQAHAREIFRSAIEHSSAKLILVHNHPSGDPSPSRGDKLITSSLVEAGKVIGIEVVDHIIIGERSEMRSKDYLSFREQGLIT